MSLETDDVTRPVRGQLDAYNARDIDAFMRFWAEDCRCYAFPDELIAEGAAALRARHVERFKEPNLFGRLLSRIAVGTMVVDHETVTRTFPEGPGEVDVVCIYEVEGGRIARAWFKTGAPRLHAAAPAGEPPPGRGGPGLSSRPPRSRARRAARGRAPG